MRATLSLLWMLVSSPAIGADWFAGAVSHIGMADFGQGIGATIDLGLFLERQVISELAIGVDAAAALPLMFGDHPGATELSLRAVPRLSLLIGEEQMWTYAKAGCGVDGLLRGGGLEPALILAGAIGFAVAPETLLIAFGFEFSGQLDIAGQGPSRGVGVGAFMGYRF